MIDLLVSSLMADGGLEMALNDAIKCMDLLLCILFSLCLCLNDLNEMSNFYYIINYYYLFFIIILYYFINLFHLLLYIILYLLLLRVESAGVRARNRNGWREIGKTQLRLVCTQPVLPVPQLGMGIPDRSRSSERRVCL